LSLPGSLLLDRAEQRRAVEEHLVAGDQPFAQLDPADACQA
jgi:hypothetical protein